MQRRAHQLDPTRLCTAAGNVGNAFEGVNSVIDVRGWNYHPNDVDAYHREHPAQPEIGTEQGSTVCTRGIYANDKERGYVSAYDDNAPHMGATRRKRGGRFLPRARGCPAGLSGPDSTIVASRRPTAGPASIRISAFSTPAAFPRTTSTITSPGGATAGPAPAAALELARQGGPGHRRALPEQLRGGRVVPQRPKPRPQNDAAELRT